MRRKRRTHRGARVNFDDVAKVYPDGIRAVWGSIEKDWRELGERPSNSVTLIPKATARDGTSLCQEAGRFVAASLNKEGRVHLMPLADRTVDTTANQAPPDQATVDRGDGVEPSSWWWLISIILGAAGAYTLLIVHLILDATDANAWMLILLAVPAAFFCSSAVVLFAGSDLSAGERLSAASAGLFGYSPREKSRRSTHGRP